jgi:hypothetical protein
VTPDRSLHHCLYADTGATREQRQMSTPSRDYQRGDHVFVQFVRAPADPLCLIAGTGIREITGFHEEMRWSQGARRVDRFSPTA